ncbi:hypothetical protein ACOME3_002755 [Neoechinorhynchus agilis]
MNSDNSPEDYDVPEAIADYLLGLIRYLSENFVMDAGVDINNIALEYAVSSVTGGDYSFGIEPDHGNVTRRAYMESSIEEEDEDTGSDPIFEKTEEQRAGAVLIKQGEKSDSFYVIENGKFQFVANGSMVYKFINTGCFGELALVFNTPRNATIKAETDGMLWTIDRRASIPLFNGIDLNSKIYLLNSVKQEIHEDGDCIFRQWKDADCMYFVEDGIVRIEMESNGDYFGELALIDNKPRAASAFAVGKTRVGVMTADKFKEYMEPMLDTLEENKKKYYEQVKTVFGD